MKIHKIISSAYSVIDCKNGKYQLVKVLGEYAVSIEAYSDMVNIINNKKSESNVEQEWPHNRRIN